MHDFGTHTEGQCIFWGLILVHEFIGNQRKIILNFLFNILHVNVLATFQTGDSECDWATLSFVRVHASCVCVCVCVRACVLCMLGARAELPTPIQKVLSGACKFKKLFFVPGLPALISNLRLIQLNFFNQRSIDI